MKYPHVLIPLILFTACNITDHNEKAEEAQATKYNIVNLKSSPYLDFYLNDNEAILQCNFKEHPYSNSSIFVKERNTEDNTIMLTDEVGIRLHDSYTIENDGKNAHFRITREASIISSKTEGKPIQAALQKTTLSSAPYSYETTNDIYVQAADSIVIIRPSTSECNCIPMCYYDNMEIEWNPDYNNTNGVLIITEWNGVTLTGASVGSGTTIGIDFVDDTGVTTLNNDLFNGMPDEAFVNLWLLRANIVDVSHVGDGTLENLMAMANEDPSMMETFLEENPEFLLLLQEMTLGCGAVAMLPFYLIRNL